MQNHDKRVIFTNAYEGDKALIGTTDVPWDGAPETVQISNEEIDYLLSAVNHYFKHPLCKQDILQTFSGVRPLYDDGKGNPSAVTRDYVFDLDDSGGRRCSMSSGGKITTFRKLAEHALQKFAPTFPKMGGDWTASATLPGGRYRRRGCGAFHGASAKPVRLATTHAIASLHADLRHADGAISLAGLGMQFGPNFYEADARYLMSHEWAASADDMLTRRTKHGLHMNAAQKAAFETWLGSLVRQSA